MENGAQVWAWIGKNLWQIIIVLSFFVEIAPIKVNPWSSVFKWIKKHLIGEISDQLEIISKEVKENEKDRIRWEILDFANSCRNGRRHTKDEFRHIIDLNDKYKKLLSLTGDANGVFESEYGYIKRLYAERQNKNDFL